MQATGTFTVKLDAQKIYVQGAEGITLGRMHLDKVFTGDLQATSQGEMLSARTPLPGSAGYVAIEQVTGELNGNAGSFVLQHFGIMHAGENNLVLEVVPGSGTGALATVSGSMQICIKEGVHHYQFTYSL